MSAVARTLREARKRYSANPSHAPFRSSPARGTFCACTAVYSLRRSSFEHERALDALATAVEVERPRLERELGGPTNRWLIEWNAKQATSVVLAAFDRAIEAAS